jgi:hypothetical protein
MINETQPRSTANHAISLRLVRSHPRFCDTDEPEERCHWVLGNAPFDVLHYGIGLGPGRGATPQTADAQGGRGGVGIRDPFPCVAAEPPAMQAPL